MSERVIEEVDHLLDASFPDELQSELVAAYREAKRSFYLGGHRLAEVEAGRFCEAAFRMLEFAARGAYTPLSRPLRSEMVIKGLEQLPSNAYPDSLRIHIPRSLRVVYDIRNKRDAAHLADGIDPNLQDASLVVGVLDWVLAEFVRLYRHVSPAEAQAVVEALVTRKVPLVENFSGFLKVLDPSLSPSDHCLVLLYHCAPAGATYGELSLWARREMKHNLRRTLSRLERRDVHRDGERYFITRAGIDYVETNGLIA
jgi:hypothetical protein